MGSNGNGTKITVNKKWLYSDYSQYLTVIKNSSKKTVAG